MTLLLVMGVVALGVTWYRCQARLERRLFGPERRVPVRHAPPRAVPPEGPVLPPGPEGHLQFAQGLVRVSEWYLAECEDQARGGVSSQ